MSLTVSLATIGTIAGRMAGKAITVANAVAGVVPVGNETSLAVVPGSQRDTVRELEALRAAEPEMFRRVFARPPRSAKGMQERIRELQRKVVSNARTAPARIAKADAKRQRKAARRQAVGFF